MLEHQHIDLEPAGRGAELTLVPHGRGLVMFAHANGSDRTSPRSATIVRRLNERDMCTLAADLLTPSEAEQPDLKDDITLLTTRLQAMLDALPAWLHTTPIGILGAGHGAAAAIEVAVRQPQRVRALVLWSGRLLGVEHLWRDLRAPTLLLVGGSDPEVLALNRRAYARLLCTKRIEVIPRATRLFLEAGTLSTVPQHAGDWFCAHLQPAD